MRALLTKAAAVGAGILTAASAPATDWVYWVDRGDNLNPGSIQRAQLDGSNAQVLVSGIAPVGLTLDAGGGRMYWTEWNTPAIWQANLDGTGAAQLDLPGATLVQPTDIEFAAGWIYWTDRMGSTIWRAHIGTNQVELLYAWDAIMPLGLAVDTDDGVLLWSTENDELWRGTITGGTASTLGYGPLYGTADVVVDSATNRMFWSEIVAGRISVANYNTNVWSQVFVADAILPGGLAVQPGRNRDVRYFADVASGRLLRWDGSSLDEIHTGMIQPGDVELLLVNATANGRQSNLRGAQHAERR